MVRVTSVLVMVAVLVGCAHAPPEITPLQMARLRHPDPQTAATVARLLPAARAEELARETRALTEGQPLDAHQTAIARAVGVQAPERIRLLRMQKIPPIADAELGALWRVERAWGMTTGYGVTVTRSPPPDWLLAHEFAHVAQYERQGGAVMLHRYLLETLVLPNNLIPVEREAIAVADGVAKSPAYGF